MQIPLTISLSEYTMIKIHLHRIDVSIHFTFLLLIALLFYLENGRLAVFSILFSSLHESAHALAAIALGYTPEMVSAGLFGGVLHLEEACIKPRDALIIHQAGPLCNLSIAAMGYLVYTGTGGAWLYDMIAANLILALFNLLPLYPLDGGKIVSIYLTEFWGCRTACMISKIISGVFTCLLFLFGLYLIQYNMVNILICALAINLYIAGREDGRYSFRRLMSIYTALEKEKPL